MMFDSTNLNPSSNFHPLSFPFPSSLPSLPLLINTHQDLLLDHHQYFPLSNLPPNVPTVHEMGEMGAPGFCAPPPPEPKAAAAASKKAARHSKIQTSQGLRDRRVRLSIGIAREFFDLQDMLGFDKASKTLDWLLSKSKKAIKELAMAKHDPAAASSTCHVATTQMDSTGSNHHSGEVMNLVKETTRARARSGRARKKIWCGNPTVTNQSALTRDSTSDQVNLPSQRSSGPSHKNKNKNQDNNDYFPNLALDWENGVGYNSILQPSSYAISNITGTGLGAQREHTNAYN